jgi:acetyl-CoA carboxylase biotin carboxylase subunit
VLKITAKLIKKPKVLTECCPSAKRLPSRAIANLFIALQVTRFTSMIRKLLVANRGEIALRVMRSARELGIKTVAVYSEADRQALHVRFADEAVAIGPPPSSESYLRIEKIIAAARSTGADAVHPGYGFLSENEDFAQAVIDAGLIFVGPPPKAIEVMGSKLAAKNAAAKFKVPLVPGTSEPISDVVKAKKLAKEIGYPVLIKASAGGGGKGMRIVQNEGEFSEQMERAVSEAISAFGDGSVFIEKYVTQPRHIEFQIFGDQHGNVVHLFERECSIQRRHQKVVEEAPSSILTPELRARMGEAAVNVAKSCGYYNAGTVEFILDEKKNFYFLEMNTRLQVEHPVTEQITGLDLVKLQIRIAEGNKIPFKQEDLAIHGHAVEVRVYAEDPANNFLPDIGTLRTYRRPQGHGIRVDDGFEEGMSIPFYYDPMIAKMICHADTREAAIEKTIRAINEYDITGVETTLGFCRFVMEHEAFRSGNFDTKFVEQYFRPELLHPASGDRETAKIAAALSTRLFESTIATTTNHSAEKTINRWKANRLNK